MTLRPSTLLIVGFLVCLNTAHGTDLDAVRYYNQGVDAATQGETANALRMFEKASRLDPNFPDAHYNRGLIYYRNGQYDKAQQAFEQTRALAPNDSQTLFNLALTQEKRGLKWGAKQSYQAIPKGDRLYSTAQERASALGGVSNPQQPAPKKNWFAKKPTVKRDTAPQQVYKPSTIRLKALDAAPAVQPIAQPKPTPLKLKELPATTSKPAAPETGKRTVQTFARGFMGPTGMVIGANNHFYVANYTKNQVLKVLADGKNAVFAEGLSGPVGMVYNPRNQYLYVANYLDNTVARISPDGKVSTMASGLRKPYHLLLDEAKQVLYVSEQETNAISLIRLGP
jgi:tetratricopeptide (TPR) repeat protein